MRNVLSCIPSSSEPGERRPQSLQSLSHLGASACHLLAQPHVQPLLEAQLVLLPAYWELALEPQQAPCPLVLPLLQLLAEQLLALRLPALTIEEASSQLLPAALLTEV